MTLVCGACARIGTNDTITLQHSPGCSKRGTDMTITKTQCRIKWVDQRGSHTPDTNDAIGFVRCMGYTVPQNPSYKPTPSEWFPICADHMEQFPRDGRWEYVQEVPTP